MDRHILKEIKCLDNLIKKCAVSHEMSDSEKLNQTQLQILTYLAKHENEEICQKDLEAETGLKKASITGALDSLEDKKAIIRTESKKDRRRNVITLSERAEKYRKELAKVFEEIEQVVTKDITEEEIESFYKVIDKIKKNIKDYAK